MATNIPLYPLTAENSRTEEPVEQSQHPDSTMTKYTPPAAYYPPPPPDPKTHIPGRPADNRARGPSFGTHQIPSVAPTPNPSALAPPYIVQTPPQHPPEYAHQQQYPPQQQSYYTDPRRPSISYADNVAGQQYSSSPNNTSYMRPGSSQRRVSASSAHSHHSRDSRRLDRSRHSSRSRDRRDSYDDSYDDDGKPRKPRHKHSSSKHKDEHRPTWGDTVFGVFDVVKSALGPRDKY